MMFFLTAISLNQCPLLVSDKGQGSHADLEIPAEFLAEDAHGQATPLRSTRPTRTVDIDDARRYKSWHWHVRLFGADVNEDNLMSAMTICIRNEEEAMASCDIEAHQGFHPTWSTPISGSAVFHILSAGWSHI
ncbi:hypothetical protein Tco_1091756 [Tanacetum coccineum]|uniref:Uncharacterized protein n=1 Tax=Tanacetum coccineum TaxID=301880 RepID=A0ABQ5I820_9ASTR